jgi:hypothetical protein
MNCSQKKIVHSSNKEITMAAPLIGLGLKVAAGLAAKKAGTAAGKQVVKAIKGKKAGEAYAATAKKKAANKASDAAAIKKAKSAKPAAAPKSNVTVKKANPYTADNLNKIRTVEGARRAVKSAKTAEEIRKAKAAQRMLEIKKGKK